MFVEYMGILGIGLAAILAAIGYLFKSLEQKRMQYNEVLFNLLEIWDTIRIYKISSADISKEYFKEVKEILKRKYNSKRCDLNEYKEQFEGVIKTIIAQKGHRASITLKDQYKDCVYKLSKISPILAYRLNGRQNIYDNLSIIDGYYSSIEGTIVRNANGNNEIAQFKSASEAAKEWMVMDTLQDLERDILSVAKKTGLHNYISTLRQLRTLRGNINQKISTDRIEDYFDYILQNMSQIEVKNLL